MRCAFSAIIAGLLALGSAPGCGDGSAPSVQRNGDVDVADSDSSAVDSHETCALWGPARACPLGRETPWDTRALGFGHGEQTWWTAPALGSNGTVCFVLVPWPDLGFTLPSAGIGQVWCAGPSEPEAALRAERADAFRHTSLVMRLHVDDAGRVHQVWATGDFGTQTLWYGVDDGPAERVGDGAPLGVLYDLTLDDAGRPVIAYSTGGVLGPGAHTPSPFALHVATRVGVDTWRDEELLVGEHGSEARLALSGAARWLVWTRSLDGYPPSKAWVVDIAAGREEELAAGTSADRFIVFGGFVAADGAPHVLATRNREDLIDAWRVGSGAWSERVVLASRKLPDQGDVGHWPTSASELELAVDGGGAVHAWFWETDGAESIASVHARLDPGASWVVDKYESHFAPTGDPALYGLAAVYALTAGPDGTVRVLIPGALRADPGRDVLIVLTGSGCAAYCGAWR